jgi:Ino eighty subunit 1
VNPFDDQHARKHLGLIPELVPLSEEQLEKENIDPEDERNYAAKMTKLRIDFLARNAQQGGENNNSNSNPKDRKGIAKSKVRAPSRGKSIPTKRERSDPDSAVEDDSDHLGTFHFLIRP